MKTALLFCVSALAAGVSPALGQSFDCDHCPQPVAKYEPVEPEEYRSTAFNRSYFTHAPNADQRVVQYAPTAPAYRTQGYYERSAFRYTQSTIGKGRNADRLNVVETWGRGAEIRPYGEWERPFRKGAQPIWMTDPQAYFYGSDLRPFLSENRERVTFEGRGKGHGKKKDHGKGKGYGKHDKKPKGGDHGKEGGY